MESLEIRALGRDADPFLEVPAAEADLSWRSLISERPQIYRISLQEPKVDLGAPLPQAAGGGHAASDTVFPALDIYQLKIVKGSVRSGPVSEDFDEWLDGWLAERLTLEGFLVDGNTGIEVQEGGLTLESHRRPSITAELMATVSAGDNLGFTVESLKLVGDSLGLRATGHGRLEAGAPIDVSLDLRSDLAGLFPDLTASGEMEADGRLTFTPSPSASLVGDLRVSARDIPAELLDPLLANAGQDALALEGTHLDLTADLTTRIELEALTTEMASDLVSGQAHLTWRRREEPLVIASLETLKAVETEGPETITVDVDVRVLPQAKGARSLKGRVRIPGWKHLSKSELENLRLEIRQEDLGALAEVLGLTSQALGGFRPAGSLSLTARADGPLTTPDIELEGAWKLKDRRLISLAAQSVSMSRLVFRGELLPDSAGVRRIEGTWIFPGLEGLHEGSFNGLQLQIDLPDLASSLTEVEALLEQFMTDPDRRQELLAALSPEVRHRLEGSLRVDLTAEGPLKAPRIDVTAHWVPADSEQLRLTANYAEQSLNLQELSGALRGVLPGEEILRFAARGRVGVVKPVRDAELELQIFDPLADVRRLDISARLEGGTLTLDGSAPSVPGRIQAAIPLATLVDTLPDSVGLADLPLILDRGSLELEISELGLDRASEIGSYLAEFDAKDLRIDGVLDAVVALDPRKPLEAIGTLEIEGLRIEFGESQIQADSTLRIDLDEGQITLQPSRFWTTGTTAQAPLNLRLTGALDPDWLPAEGLLSLIEHFDLDLDGVVDSSLATPFLAGGVASGPVSLAVWVTGTMEAPRAEIRIDGPEARMVLPGKYRTEISEAVLVVEIDRSGGQISEGRARLNRGEVKVSGSVDQDRVVQLGAELRGVRYRLDYGLTVSLDGNLDLTWPPEGRRRLSGTIELERGSLRRNVQLERELIRMFNPSDLAGGGSALQESIDLDINLITRKGVRIKNNLADLRADWDQIRVRGTLAQPILAGTIEVDPGGLLTAYGQTVRIDQGSLIFTGDPGEPPRLDFETTTAAEDPRIQSQWDSVWSTGQNSKGPGGGFWDRYDPQSSANTFQADEFATGLSSYFQNRFLQSVTGGAPVVELSVQPLPLMGETDTTARVTMSYHLTPQISYLLSQNPREAEGRTDILNLQNFAVAPSLRAQLFRNDEGNEGVTLQQMLEFGGGRRAEKAMPRLRSIELAEPRAVGKRRVRRATGLRRGEPVAEGADFDIEIDMLDSLARSGFPAAEVDVEIQPLPRNRVIVGIEIEPGTRVDFEFSGDKPQRRARQDIVSLYQPTTLQDSPALERVRRDTVRALRARGFVDPQVEVSVERTDPKDPTSDRIIRVHGEGGRQVNPRTLEFHGVPDDVEQALVALFSSRLTRVELAEGEVVADQLFSQSMRTLGYIEPRIVSRQLSADGSTLTVEVEPGSRQSLANVEIVGAEPKALAELENVLTLKPGDPLRTGQIAATAFRMEDSLRNLGFANASVQGRIEPTPGDESGNVDVYYDVATGLEHRIGELETEGLANSSPLWVKKVSKLESGELLTDSSLALARRRLARTGVFQRIAIRLDEPADSQTDPVVTPITFELEEHPRYRVTYGLRGESTREVGAVVDLSDLNFLGRGQTLGLRLIYATLERNARLYWSIPRLLQTNKTLEFFVEARREESVNALDDGDEAAKVIADIREAWAQITFPWGRRSVHRFYTVYKQSVTENRSVPDEPEQRVVNPFSGWQVSYDTGERSFFETSTDKATIFLGSDLSFTSDSLGSDYTGYGFFGQIKPQVPLAAIGDSALVWVHNYRIGLKEATDDVELPFFDRLFAGGEFSVRGYPTNSLGPVNEDGVPLGGEAMFVTNQELRFPIWTLLSGVAFFDAGNVWATLQDVDSTLFTSIGAGLRADSPIGPLRLDLAFPLDRREGDPEYKLYFGLGQTF